MNEILEREKQKQMEDIQNVYKHLKEVHVHEHIIEDLELKKVKKI